MVSILEAIGNTPLVRVRRCAPPNGAELWLKLEYRNPTGSAQWVPERVDHVEPIEDNEAIEMTRRLATEEGIFAGISTGANVVGAHRLAERLGPRR